MIRGNERETERKKGNDADTNCSGVFSARPLKKYYQSQPRICSDSLRKQFVLKGLQLLDDDEAETRDRSEDDVSKKTIRDRNTLYYIYVFHINEGIMRLQLQQSS